MRIVCEKGEFDLPVDFEVEITVSNPFLSDIGEQSTPFNLPVTDNNLWLLGYNNRFDALYKPLDALRVQVMDGVLCRTCQMRINSIDVDFINTTLYLGNSDFYNKIDGVNLQSLDWDMIEPDFPTLEEKVLHLLTLLKNLYKAPESEFLHDRFVVVPVATTESAEDITGYQELWGQDSGNVFFDYNKNFNYIILNDFARYPVWTNVFGDEDENGYLHFIRMQGERLSVQNGENSYVDVPRKLRINGEIIEVGIGYGVTPFYRLSYVLNKVFTYFGYELTDFYVVQKDILLNNVVDALFEGKIQGNQLVPDINIKDFLLKIEKLYAVRFIPDEISRRVKMISYYGFLSSDIVEDLSSYVCSRIVRGKSEFINLVVERNNSKKTTSVSQKEKEEAIKIDTLTEKIHYGQRYGNAVLYPVIQQISNVVHLNSVKVNAGTLEEQEIHSMKDVRVCGYSINTDYYVSDENASPDDGFSLKYNRSVPASVEDTGAFGGADVLELSYYEYKDFLARSNVPVEVDLLLSKSEIQRLDITRPYLLFNRKVFFEKMTYKLGADNRCKAFFRTAEPYVDRP